MPDLVVFLEQFKDLQSDFAVALARFATWNEERSGDSGAAGATGTAWKEIKIKKRTQRDGMEQKKTEQNRTEQNRTEQNREN